MINEPKALVSPCRIWAPVANFLAGLLLIVPAAGLTCEASAREAPVSSADSFRIGNQGVLCTAQLRSEDSHYRSIFDRAYDVVCRDAASPVATLYALRSRDSGDDQVMAQINPGNAACDPATTPAVAGLPGLLSRTCRDKAGLTRTIYVLRGNGQTFAATGLLAYESAVLLGLRSLVVDREVPGAISVASIGADDPAALAQVQAERLDPEQARVAAYVHANDGSYPDASEFFDRLVSRSQLGEPGATRPAEYLANLAAQQSTLGNFAEADTLFARAQHASTGGDPAYPRMFRNLLAMHKLNQHDPAGAIAILDTPLPQHGQDSGFTPARVGGGYIDQPLAQRLELDSAARNRFWSGELPLSDRERETLLDAQASYLRGEAERLSGHKESARAGFAAATAQFNSVRSGQVISMAWLPANVETGLAAMADAEGKPDVAEGFLRQAVQIDTIHYPDSAALLAARARLAAAMARHGKTDLALAEYRELARIAPDIVGGSEALRPLIGPYFDALAAHSTGPGAVADFFLATQALVRPGVAQTQAVMARELSAGSDAAADLFRQSLELSRELVTLDQDIAHLSDPEQVKLGNGPALAAAVARRRDVATRQTDVIARMDAFPRYRVVANQAVTLADLQAALRPDEAYYKLVLVGDSTFALWARAGQSRIFRVDASPSDLETIVDAIRDSISLEQNNQLVTNPFDLASARHLYQLLFGPIDDDIAKTRHVIFEPDGALLKLPANLLVTADDGIAAYAARQKLANADAFDFTGVAWLGRSHIITTAVSAASFLDIRKTPPSAAPRRFLGLGQNAPLTPAAMQALSVNRDPCDWPLATWNHPVSGSELTLAARLVGGNGNEVETGEAFSDTSLKARTDLADFRIVQFATHGLVTAPRPGCPARPELVTSFGTGDTDGLLSFKDIFDLHLNADTVILSACDTAGAATAMATREAGLKTGGNFALDGLVRAFVGAGARGVVASHWPVPDDFNATTRLMTGIFEAGIGHSLGDAMQAAQIQLMDDPLTSHPYYWAAFAIVGDATKPLTTQ
ncbi:MAG: CHAT domain-containing protein [Pseudomonadota bacterium]|nr:CHAT domain-containing protein [Pseudomonadota bacterium]